MAQTKTANTKQLRRFDFTIHDDNGVLEITQITEWLLSIGKKWGFQKESCPTTEKIHYQGRFNLKGNAKRLNEIIKKEQPFSEDGLHIHYTPTSNKITVANFYNYVTKDESRVDGPWTDKMDLSPSVLTEQMKTFLKWDLLPWQKSIIDETSTFDMRAIDLVYDPIGNAGKSLFSEYMEYNKVAEEIPPYRLMDDIFQWVATRPIKSIYIIDMPRGMKKDRLGDFYSGVEVIKNGVAYDKRHFAKKIRFNRPRIIVFTNELPVLDLMSKDRWNLWTIDENKNLVSYEPESDDEIFELEPDSNDSEDESVVITKEMDKSKNFFPEPKTKPKTILCFD